MDHRAPRAVEHEDALPREPPDLRCHVPFVTRSSGTAVAFRRAQRGSRQRRSRRLFRRLLTRSPSCLQSSPGSKERTSGARRGTSRTNGAGTLGRMTRRARLAAPQSSLAAALARARRLARATGAARPRPRRDDERPRSSRSAASATATPTTRSCCRGSRASRTTTRSSATSRPTRSRRSVAAQGRTTTCDRKKDTAAYWAPTRLRRRRPVDPYGAVVYYRRLTVAKVRAYPNGLTIVAGNSHAGTPQSRRIVFWDCGVVKTTLYGPMRRGSQPARHAARRVEHAAALPARVEAPAARQLPGLLERQDDRQLRPQAPHGLLRRRPLPAEPPGRGRGALARLPVPAARPAPSRSPRAASYSAHADFLNAWDEHALERSRRPLPERGQAVRHRLARRRPTSAVGRRWRLARPASNAAAGGVSTDVTISTRVRRRRRPAGSRRGRPSPAGRPR